MNRRAFLGASACALGAGALSLPVRGAPAQTPPRGIVLVTLDTLRADHLPWHGYPRNTAPFLDTLSAKSATFLRAYTSCSHTGPAHASILSGWHLPQHKYRYNAQEGMSAKVKLAAQFFQEAGYHTAGFSAVSWMPVLGRGFQDYHQHSVPGGVDAAVAQRIPYVQAEEQVDRVLHWLETEDHASRFFVWLHLFDAHDPWAPPQEDRDALGTPTGAARESLIDHWQNRQGKFLEEEPWQGDLENYVDSQLLYDAEIHYADRQLRRLYAHLEKLGANDNTTWVLSADHGHGFGSHHYMGHGYYLYEEQVLVPMLCHHGGGRFQPRSHTGLTQHVDILPTLADLAGIDIAQEGRLLPGMSLVPFLDSTKKELPPRLLYTERRKKMPQDHTSSWPDDPMFGVIGDRHKVIVHQETRLEYFDLATDPLEAKDLGAGPSVMAESLRNHGAALRSLMQRSSEDIEDGVRTDVYDEDLEALGYL